MKICDRTSDSHLPALDIIDLILSAFVQMF